MGAKDPARRQSLHSNDLICDLFHRKRIREMLESAALESHHIKAEIDILKLLGHDVLPGAIAEVLDLVPVYALDRMTELFRKRRFHFHENHQPICPDDQVDLLMSGSPVALEHLEPVLGVKPGSQFLEGPALPDLPAITRRPAPKRGHTGLPA